MIIIIVKMNLRNVPNANVEGTSYPVLHHSYLTTTAIIAYNTNNALFVLQAMTAAVEEWDLGYIEGCPHVTRFIAPTTAIQSTCLQSLSLLSVY